MTINGTISAINDTLIRVKRRKNVFVNFNLIEPLTYLKKGDKVKVNYTKEKGKIVVTQISK